MAISDERRRELLAAVGLNGGPVETVASSAVGPPQPRAVSAAVAQPLRASPLRKPRPTQSVTVALREEAERTTPPGIRPEFAFKPMPRQRSGAQQPAFPPLREGELRVDLALWERQQEIAREVARDEWVRSLGHDPYARMHTSLRNDD